MTIHKLMVWRLSLLCVQLTNRNILYFNRPFPDNRGTALLQGNLIYFTERLVNKYINKNKINIYETIYDFQQIMSYCPVEKQYCNYRELISVKTA